MSVSVAEEVLGCDVADIDDFVTWSEWALARVGFRPSNALALVALCRDEIMDPFEAALSATWGRPFDVGALGGLVLVGRTGLAAALSHAPGEDGRHRFIAFCFPHIGIDADGTVGRVQRRGMLRASSACGALVALRAQLARGEVAGAIDPDDVEQSLLSRIIGSSVDLRRVPSLVELTDLARTIAVADLGRYVDLARAAEPVDVAYVSGLLVHLPDARDVVARVEAHVLIDEQRIELPH